MSPAPGAAFRPASLRLTSFGLALAVFMQVLDSTIANVALPTIAGNLGVSSSQSAWVITAFTVCNAIALPLTGWLARRFGEVPLFVAATLLFTLASALCGLAPSFELLVLFRALQGAFAGPMYPIAQSLLLSIYPPEKRPQALALLAMITVVAPIAGPILGGWITDEYSWPWIFLINVPIGLFAAGVVWTQLGQRPEVRQWVRIDRVGLLLLVLGVGTLQIVLDKGNELDWFGSDFIVVASLISAVALVAFAIWELTDKEPIVDLRLFRHNNFRAGTIALTLGYGAFFGSAVLIPLWLQTQLGYTAFWAGLATAPNGFLPLLLTPLVGRYAAKVDLRIMAGLSFLVMGACSLWRTTFTPDVDFYTIALVQLVQGIGIALFFMPVLTIVLSDLQPHEIPAGSGLATFFRQLGASFAASLTTFIWDRRASLHHAQLTEHVSVYDPAARAAMDQIGQIVPGGLPGTATQLNQIVTHQAYMLSTLDYFFLVGWLFIMLIVLLLMAKPPFTARGRAPVADH